MLLDPDADLRDDSLVAEEATLADRPVTARARTRTKPGAVATPEGRRRRRGSEPSRNPIVRGLRGYFGAYLPLFAVFCVLFAGVFVFSTLTHTPTAAESWTSISDKWKPQTDAARAKVFAAADKKDVPAEVVAFKELATALRGWADQLEKSPTHWTAKTGVDTDNQQAAAGVLGYITDMRAYAIAIDSVTSAGACAGASPSAATSAGASASASPVTSPSDTASAAASASPASPSAVATTCVAGSADSLRRYSDALAQHSDELTQDDSTWNQDYRSVVYLILGTDPMANTSPVATLMLPTQVPSVPPASGSPSASGSPEASGSPSPSVSAAPSASPSPSPAPSAS